MHQRISSPAVRDPLDLVVTALDGLTVTVADATRIAAATLRRMPALRRSPVDESRLAGGDVALHARTEEEAADEARLVRESVSGDERAWAAIVSRHGPAVKRLVAARFPGDQEDLVQEIFAKVFAGLPTFVGLASLNTWILRIAHNHLSNHARQRRRRQAHEVLAADLSTPGSFSLEDVASDEDVSAAQVYGQSRVRRIALRIFSEIDEPYRVALVLTQVCGCNYEEAGRLLGVATGTIKSRIARARAIISRKMAQVGWDA